MKFARLTIIILAAAYLGACTQLSQTVGAIRGITITQPQLDAAQNTYDGTSLVALDKYAGLIRCRTGQKFSLNTPCHDRVLLKQWRGIDQSVAVAFGKTQDMITSGNNTGAVAAWNSLQNALQAAKDIAAATGATLL